MAYPTALWATAPVNEQSPPGVRAYIAQHTFTRQVVIPFQVNTAPVDPSSRASTKPGDPALPADVAGGVFYSTSFNLTGTPYQGYVGVQANSLAIISVWGATDCRTGSDPSAFCSNFDENGVGWTVRISYPWHVGQRYEFVLTTQGNGWWSVAIRDVRTHVSVSIGAVRLPTGAWGITPWSSWIEWFHAPLGGHCTDSPNAEVTFWPLTGDSNVVARYYGVDALTCKDYDSTTVKADGSATIGSFPQGHPSVSPSVLGAPLPGPTRSAVVHIASATGTGCLFAAEVRHAAPVRAGDCGANGAKLVEMPAGDDTFTLHPAADVRLCVDVADESLTTGGGFVVGVCTGHDSQRWFAASRTAPSAPALVNLHSRLCGEVTQLDDVRQTVCSASLPAQGWVIRSNQTS